MIYDGDPVEALVYFKTETSQANAAESECPNCGNVEADNILHIVEVKVIDNSGFPGKERQISPKEWYEKYKKKMMPVLGKKPIKSAVPPSNFRVPKKADQIRTFIGRNITRKFADRQYMTINLVEAPLLALILGYISKFSENGFYSFESNKNYPIFLFMSVIVALFIGLTVSAEEIFRDRKILEREKFLDLSRLSYLVSKINFLFTLSAIQTLTFVLVANAVLDVQGMIFQQWIVLFSTACFGNLLGLNISAGMRTAVSIYILIPLILVPQLLLGGAMIKFDDLHRSMTKKVYVPVLGDIMVTRWAYEALCVEQFKTNKFEKTFFRYDMAISQNDWYSSFLVPALKAKVDNALLNRGNTQFLETELKKVRYHIKNLSEVSGIKPGTWVKDLNINSINETVSDEAKQLLDSMRTSFRAQSRVMTQQKDTLYTQLSEKLGENGLVSLKAENYNENLANYVLNRMATNKIYDADDRLVQKSDPIFMTPGSKFGRAHFFAPFKQLGDLKIETLIFNVIAIWFMIFLLFVTLYYNVLKKFIRFLESLKLPIIRKFGREMLQI
jgi:hypothetical protein